jgi:hypothetical protein
VQRRVEDKKTRKVTIKWDKVPIRPDDPHEAKVNDPKTWGSFETAIRNARWRDDLYPYIGIVLGDLGDGRCQVGIDLDNCRNPETGHVQPEAVAIMQRIGGYWEVSPSGYGFKGYGFATKVPSSGNSFGNVWTSTHPEKTAKVEMFWSGRWFAVTGIRHAGDALVDITDAFCALHAELSAKPKGRKRARKTKAAREPEKGLDSGERDVLRPIPSDDRAVWLRVGMALHYKSGASAGARALWDEWSDKRREKEGTVFDPADQEKTWESFKLDCENPVTWGTVVELAREHGYSGPVRSVSNGKARTVINYRKVDRPRVLAEVECALLAAGAPIYQQLGRLVHVVRIGGRLRTKEPDKHRLRLHFQDAADFVVVDDDGEQKLHDPPLELAEAYKSLAGRWQLPELAGIVHSPTLRADGSVLQAAGYDAASGLILDTQGVEFPKIPDAPARADAERSLARLGGVFGDFPFVDRASCSVALSAVLTGAIRRTLPFAPAHWIDANDSGAGKGYLYKIISTIAFGSVVAPSPLPANETEMRKVLLAKLLRGEPAIAFDNIDEPVESAALCVLLTSETYSDRQLGHNRTPELPTNVLVTGTGNNTAVLGDLVRRSVGARLRKMERKYKNKRLLQDVAGNRPALLVDALTVLRAFFAAGRPGVDELAPMIGFDDWTASARGALVWLGEADPLETQARIAGTNARDQDAAEFFECAARLIAANYAWTASDLLKEAMWGFPERGAMQDTVNRYALGDAIQKLCNNRGAALKASFPQALSKYVDRTFGGWVLRAQQSANRSTRYSFARGEEPRTLL